MLITWLKKCSKCNGIGKVEGLGYMEYPCETCKNKRWWREKLTSFKNWISKNILICITVSFFVVMFSISFFCQNTETLTILVGSLGLIFTALKYKLDQSTYHKDLFEKRYAIFLKIDDTLRDAFQETNENGEKIDWHYLSKGFNSIFRKRHFLFSKKTNKFLDQFQQAVISISMLSDEKIESIEKKEKAEEFLRSLLDGQNLSKQFPELKIDTY